MSKTFKVNYNGTALDIRTYFNDRVAVSVIDEMAQSATTEIYKAIGDIGSGLQSPTICANKNGLHFVHRYDGGKELVPVVVAKLEAAGWKEAA